MSASIPNRADCLIVGAGPVGLLSGILLTEAGLKVRIIDSRASPSQRTRATMWTQASLALASRLGLRERFLECGHCVSQIRLLGAEGRERLTLSLCELEGSYPYLFSMSQAKAEQIFRDRLGELGVGVEWEQSFKGTVTVNDAIVSTRINGKLENYHWLLGCDGHDSSVRQSLRVGMQGVLDAGTLFVGDAQVLWDQKTSLERGTGDPAVMYGYIGADESYVFFQLDDGNSFRIGGSAAEPSQEACNDLGIKQIIYSDKSKLREFSYGEQIATRFSLDQRIFLAGDAIHKFSPCIGKGMNLGFGDVENLCWKIAWVHKGVKGEQLLSSYELERRPIAKAVIWESGQAAWGQTTFHGLGARIRDLSLKLLDSLSCLQRRVLAHQNQDDLRYPLMPGQTELKCAWLSKHQLSIGQRFPGVWVEENAQERHISELLAGRASKCSIIVLGTSTTSEQEVDLASCLSTIPDSELPIGRTLVLRPPMTKSQDLKITQAPEHFMTIFHDRMPNHVLLIRPDGFIWKVWPSIQAFVEDPERSKIGQIG